MEVDWDVADSLERRCGDRCKFLHDGRIAKTKATIDHIAIAPSGVWVIDTQNLSGKIRVETSASMGIGCSSADATGPSSSTNWTTRSGSFGRRSVSSIPTFPFAAPSASSTPTCRCCAS